MKSRQCKLCGLEFIPTNSRQMYCNRDCTKICKMCGKEFHTTCSSGSPEYCSRTCSSRAMKFNEYTCSICGSKFHPNSSRQKYCKKELHKSCPICGKDYIYQCSPNVPQTCSNPRCKHKFAHERSVEYYENTTRKCKWCGNTFVPVNNTQNYCLGKHYNTCKVCGKEFEIDPRDGQDIRKICSDECMHIFRTSYAGNPFIRPDCREKIQATFLHKYEVPYPAQNKQVQEKMWRSYKEKTGYSHPSHNPDVRSKSARSSKKGSKFELRVATLLEEFNIKYIRHYMLTNEACSHEFDFYIPDYKILVDCDGIYFHSYMSDPDGKHVLDCYDEDRLLLVPSDHIFHVIVEGQEEKDVKYLVDIIKKIDYRVFDYEGSIFEWCRTIEFPYPSYDETRMKSDYQSLCKYENSSYNPYSRLGDSIIQNFHHSIYDSHVGRYPSPKEAWYDDKLLKKVILNRLIYKNDVDPFKILKGFNISKLCPRVSVFNPVLARYIVNKYVSEYSEVFDPFSGFSGRLLGVSSTGRKYIGQDLNSIAVEESNRIVDFLKLNNCEVYCKDILKSEGSYECIITCPPYRDKEVYAKEIVFKNCDEWIDIVLSRFKCKRYVFVVDSTEKYKDKIVEEIRHTSHFVKTTEFLLVI